MNDYQNYEGSEDAFQCTAMQYLRVCYPDVLAFHVPNGGNRSQREGAKFKAQGVLAGVPDILIVKTSNGFNGFAIELKVAKRKPKPLQLERLKAFEAAGWKTLVTWSLDELIEAVDGYLRP